MELDKNQLLQAAAQALSAQQEAPQDNMVELKS